MPAVVASESRLYTGEDHNGLVTPDRGSAVPMRIEESVTLPVSPEALWPWISTPERLAEEMARPENEAMRRSSARPSTDDESADQ